MISRKMIGAVSLVIVMGGGLYWWWQHGKIYPSTDDAYLQAHIVTISAQVGGDVTKVPVVENQHVTRGELLFKVDEAPLKAALDIAQAKFDQAVQSAGANGAEVAAAEARVNAAEATLSDAQSTFDRVNKLYKEGDVAKSKLDKARADRNEAVANRKAAEAALAAAKKKLGDKGLQNAGVQAALGQLTIARINLEHATVTAPASGWIANISLRKGQIISPDQPLFSLVEDKTWWVKANFKETDLTRLRPGQPVSLSVDMYPGLKLKGHVESIGSGSGAVFSLLPPENATGNWVKVTQRFPVRIAIDDPPTKGPKHLRVGASVTATVDTSGLGKK